MSIFEGRNDGLTNCRRLLMGVEIPTPSSMTSGYHSDRGGLAGQKKYLQGHDLFNRDSHS